ncbi:polyprenyl synthetase family protein [Acetivibrio clariflavus]|uniref:Farnesyl diphosphate synthase n=1 Tax=Acetivibrio clariflavus (strain DSM 19732 / NBRC 101661 / EBR45) TaxID=720554 RepID=G8LW54_ACECE|nr:farnesyl diphosphate synthase [Acetivibrio clariflavus]AEV68658.1 geranylgeranyl pyrophosphate synthase [Acetivibrio clariflavus DSM 19732]
MEFMEKLEIYQDIVNNFLEECIKEKDLMEKSIYNAMRYSLLAGGKRLRPVLSLAVCDMLGGDLKEVLPYACAVEMIHTYSLIHDDLPSMDNDDYRRGKLTNHKVFGEALAILAGDGLLNMAFELMLENTSSNCNNIENKVKAMGYIAKSSGVRGMIGGQVVDIESENNEVSVETLEYMHRLKTGALIKASVISAAIICNASNEDIQNLENYAEGIGLAFQIKDDILDVEGNIDKLGKNVGSDASNKKTTYVSIYGLEKSKQMLTEITESAIKSLDSFGGKAAFLKELAEYLVIREM